MAACLAAAVACLMAALPLAAAAAPAAGSATAIGKTTSTRVEDYVQQQASADHIPGTAVGIVDGSRPALLRGFGNASADTSFFLGSVSKSFTALAIMQLAGQGKVNLDAPVRKYIPWFKVGDGSESDSITVLQLLDQTSGISTKAGLAELTFKPATTFVQAIEGFETFPLIARPGKVFRYSDANFTIAGYIVQQASGQSYDSYLRQHIFAPLGMTHTYAVTGTVREPGLTRGYATWFGLKIPLTEQVAAPFVPAGYIISSASDMTHYLIAQMDGGVYHGTRIVSAKAMREMHAPLAPSDGQTPVPDATSYGLGWGVGTVNGTPVIVHDGQLRDFDTAMAILPEKNIAVVLLMNQDPQVVVNDDQLYGGIMQGITTGTFPSVSQSFIIFYAIFDAIVLATLILMICSFWRTGRWLRKFRVRVTRTGFWRATARTVGLDLVIAALITVAVIYGLGALTGNVPLTPTLIVFAAPDIAVWIYALVSFFAVRAVVRAIVIAARRGSTGTEIDAQASKT
ncbi:MAG: serine hydrolase domain-containing protein [Streptosporangiaceae bacterium]